MASVFSAEYSPEAKVVAVAYFETLSEKDQRRYLAVEAVRLGFGGIEYLASVFGCSRKTIERGMAELDQFPLVLAVHRSACKGQKLRRSRRAACH